MTNQITDNSEHLWVMQLKLIDHAMPLIRILLFLRKFRVEIEAVKVTHDSPEHWSAEFVLDFKKSTKTDTVFKKVARFYDVAEVKYHQGSSFLDLKAKLIKSNNFSNEN